MRRQLIQIDRRHFRRWSGLWHFPIEKTALSIDSGEAASDVGAPSPVFGIHQTHQPCSS